MTRGVRAAWVALGVAALVSGCTRSSGAVVAMTDEELFAPGTITVGAGSTIEFRNFSDQAHTVTAYGDSLPAGASYFSTGGDSEARARKNLSEGLIDPGDAYFLPLTVPGTYRYFCIPHENLGMTGTIVVE